MTDEKAELKAQYDFIDDMAKKIKKSRGKNLDEQNTKSTLVDPVLDKLLGWDVSTCEHVVREYKFEKGDNPSDYVFKVRVGVRFLLEGKPLGTNLGLPAHLGQMIRNAGVVGVPWCGITDGDRYDIFNTSIPVPVKEKRLCSVQFTKDSKEKVMEILGLISRVGIIENRLDAHCKTLFDRQIQGAIDSIINDKKDDFLDSMKQKLQSKVREKVPNLDANTISESLNRSTTTIVVPYNLVYTSKNSVVKCDIPVSKSSKKTVKKNGNDNFDTTSRNGEEWSEQEKTALEDNWSYKDFYIRRIRLNILPGRSDAACKNMARHMKIYKNKVRKSWKDKDVASLIKQYDEGLLVSEISKNLKRSEQAIFTKISKLAKKGQMTLRRSVHA